MPGDLHIMVLKLLLAVGLGGLIGLEREAHGRPAGLRTHILVCLGSALFTIVSEAHLGMANTDSSRIAAQIVSGIGFLGAGTIIRQGSIVRGLTTAASLWTTAAIGMAAASIGTGLIYLSVVAALIVFATLSLITRVEQAMMSRQNYRDLVVTLPGGRASILDLIEMLGRLNISMLGITSEENEAGILVARLHLRLPTGYNESTINAELSTLPEIRTFTWE
jgi:putative Mg2+ transporter-C (MgtC) family protein